MQHPKRQLPTEEAETKKGSKRKRSDDEPEVSPTTSEEGGDSLRSTDEKGKAEVKGEDLIRKQWEDFFGNSDPELCAKAKVLRIGLVPFQCIPPFPLLTLLYSLSKIKGMRIIGSHSSYPGTTFLR